MSRGSATAQPVPPATSGCPAPRSVAASSSAGSPGSRSGTRRLASVAVEPAVERRFALLAERQPTLAGVGVVVGDGGAHRDVLERLREGQLSRLVDRPL